MVILLWANTIDRELVMYTFVTDLAIYLVTSSFKEKDKEAYWHSKDYWDFKQASEGLQQRKERGMTQ